MSGEGVHNPAAIDTLALEASLQAVQVDVDAIREVTDSEAILTEVADTITTDGTEQILYTEENPAGIFEPRWCKIDFTNQTATETVVVRVYYRISPGGNLRLQSATTFAGAQDPDLIPISLEPNRYGIRITIQNTAVGVHRAYDWEVFYEEAP